MKILAVNAGSSSLKFTLIELPSQKKLISGYFEKIGIGNSFYTIKINGQKLEREVDLKDHSIAVKYLIDELIGNNVISSLDEIDGVGHRIVHGADKYSESVLLNEEILEDIESFNDLAPLHNPANLVGVRAFMKNLPNTPMVGVFDTAFHQSMKEESYIYALPYEWYTKYGVRKYGFHGTSHRFINKTISEFMKRDDLKVISCHIGSGASLAAIDSGKVVDTSMGFTPTPGVVMGTRAGDFDVSILPYVMKKENKNIDEIMNDVNKKSGLLGISGISSDARDIAAAVEEGNERGILAYNIYTQKVANYIAMYNNLLDGADVICFTAGLGEMSRPFRKGIIEKISSLGVKLDSQRNEDVFGKFGKISTDDSKIPVYVVPTDEELMIALDTYDLIN
ncbi:MAG TPA: acetate kinase [Bacilli bacterium]|nr:acetate kinase [Bacilli bacterium]